MRRKKLFCGFIAYIFLTIGWICAPLFAADITVPRLELATRGFVEDDSFILSSLASADIALSGGYKYNVLLGLSFGARNLEKAITYGRFRVEPLSGGAAPTEDDYNVLADRMNNQAALSFRIAKASVRDLFDLPLELSYFIGIADTFCSGDDFPLRFGTDPIATEFKGFFYFPEGIGGDILRQYNGVHGISGSGISAVLTRWERIVPMAYLYQDIAFYDSILGVPEGGRFSGDLRLLMNFDQIKAETFGGITLGKNENVIFRGGFLAHFSSGQGADFLIQAGVPYYQQGDEFSIDNFYFLIEPRLRFPVMSLYLTFFYHPLYYMQVGSPD
ncbi:hypothetical protein LJC14_06205, partial [Treponema sp. OttesenSCG-928-L16]|nr:hypothetical protein [Treponema sp. OttesenSCG-928-L16]